MNTKLTPWILRDGFAMRCISDTDQENIGNRVALIEKTPRVRVLPYSNNGLYDSAAWLQGPQGTGPDDARAQIWCDQQLRNMGYILPGDKSPVISDEQTKLVLISVFISTAVIAGLVAGRIFPSFLELVMLGLAALRMGRIIAFENVFTPLRKPLVNTVPHAYNGDTTEPRYATGWRHAIGELMSCPICAGSWSALGLMVAWVLVPDATRLLVTVLAAVTILEVVNALIEALCWTAETMRKRSGKGQ